jgi:para-nitrobenzyl esterase
MRTIFILTLLILSTGCGSIPKVDTLPAQQSRTSGISVEGSVEQFLGIQYATATRWSLPSVNPMWAAAAPFDEMGPDCPQIGQDIMVEDCLYLNVYAPREATPSSRKPVIVWFHGGGFKAGAGGAGPKAWAEDDIVVVTFNYRLGLLGFLDHPDWSDEHPRNFGQADMVAALDWVNTNISKFGGDAENITIAGHSAGGMAVQLMMVDHRARGKFARAIAHAGYGNWPFPDIRNPASPDANGILPADLEADTPVEDLVSHTKYYHLPYIGGSELPDQPSDLFKAGKQAGVPYLAGFNSLDGAPTLKGAGFTASSFLKQFGADPTLRSLYADEFDTSDLLAAERIFGDLRYGVSARFTAEKMADLGQPGYLFYFDDRRLNEAGSPHGAQYEKLFGADAFAQKTYYLNFIKNGSPNTEDSPIWRTYSDNDPSVMLFDPMENPLPSMFEHRLDYLERLLSINELNWSKGSDLSER